MPLFKKKGVAFSVKRGPKLRANWQVWNLYQLSRFSPSRMTSKSYFQQKWAAKAMTRAYHGEYVGEKQWERMFSRRTAAVVPMNPDRLAASDGAEFAAGRGSGRELRPTDKVRTPEASPYMQMVYHPLERRLDTAIFRALFASSTGQARQMVVHGHVKVNGKKMVYPGYLLNPGDMFQVDVEQVLTATGCPKNYLNNKNNTLDEAVGGQARLRALRRNSHFDPTAAVKTGEAQSAVDHAEKEQVIENEQDLEEEEEEEDEDLKDDAMIAEEAALEGAEEDPQRATKKALLMLRARTKSLESDPPGPNKKLSATQKQEARALSKKLRSSMSRVALVTASMLDDFEAEFANLQSRIIAGGSAGSTGSAISSPTTAAADTPTAQSKPSSVSAYAKRKAAREAEQAALEKRLAQEGNDNAHDPMKPYLTPWQPKDYMSAFAFIPRYLEVNQNICSAVYLRHPVVKPGLAEVPTPFPIEIGQAAFNWYLRRR